MRCRELSAYRAPGRSERIRRSSTDRVIAGVAGGLADHLGVDPLYVRIAFVLTTIWGGIGAIVYFVMWAVLPEGEEVENVLATRLERGEISADQYREMLGDMARTANGGRRRRTA